MATNTKKRKSKEYPRGSGIKILSIENATSGETFGTSYMVTVPQKVTGKGRIRKQFSDLKKARRFADDQFKGAKADGAAFFKLTTIEKQEIGIAVPRLREKGVTITEAIDYALRHLRPAGGAKLLSEVIEEFQSSKRKRYEVGDIAGNTLRDFVTRSQKLLEALGNHLVFEVSKQQIRDWIEGLTVGPQTKANYLSAASQVFVYAKQQRYLAESPIDGLSDNDRKELHGRLSKRPPIKLLSIGEAEGLINFTANEHPGFLGVVTLGLFCGIRTEELKKLTWDFVNLGQGFVTIPDSIAKKRRLRNVTIPGNAMEWLSCCGNRKGQIAPYSGKKFESQFLAMRLKAGFQDEEGRSTWPSNAMRHSFGSYHCALHENSLLTAKELGHKANDDILFNHYRALATKADGERYFAIKPAASSAKVLEFAG